MSEAQSSNPAADSAMERYADGDEVAFGDLYDALAPRLLAFLSRKLNDRPLVADILQDTLLRIHCARARFVKGSWVTPWAFAIARRLVLTRARRKKLECLSADGQSHQTVASGWPGPEDVAGSREGTAWVGRQVARLPAPQREAFELVYYGEMSHAEAAETLGITVASVKLRVHRANKTLRRSNGETSESEP